MTSGGHPVDQCESNSALMATPAIGTVDAMMQVTQPPKRSNNRLRPVGGSNSTRPDSLIHLFFALVMPPFQSKLRCSAIRNARSPLGGDVKHWLPTGGLRLIKHAFAQLPYSSRFSAATLLLSKNSLVSGILIQK